MNAVNLMNRRCIWQFCSISALLMLHQASLAEECTYTYTEHPGNVSACNPYSPLSRFSFKCSVTGPAGFEIAWFHNSQRVMAVEGVINITEVNNTDSMTSMLGFIELSNDDYAGEYYCRVMVNGAAALPSDSAILFGADYREYMNGNTCDNIIFSTVADKCANISVLPSPTMTTNLSVLPSPTMTTNLSVLPSPTLTTSPTTTQLRIPSFPVTMQPSVPAVSQTDNPAVEEPGVIIGVVFGAVTLILLFTGLLIQVFVFCVKPRLCTNQQAPEMTADIELDVNEAYGPQQSDQGHCQPQQASGSEYDDIVPAGGRDMAADVDLKTNEAYNTVQQHQTQTSDEHVYDEII